MMSKTTLALGLAAGMLLSFSALAGTGTENLKPVKDARGANVIDARGDCVVTKWEGTGKCGEEVKAAEAEPAPAPAEEPAPLTPVHNLSLEQKTVYFDFNKSKLDQESKSKLDNLVDAVKKSPDIKHVKVVGYADNIGKPDYNQRLSQKRADTVTDYLVANGIANAQTADVRALGERTASDECKGLKPRKKLIQCLRTDRRVEVEIEFEE